MQPELHPPFAPLPIPDHASTTQNRLRAVLIIATIFVVSAGGGYLIGQLIGNAAGSVTGGVGLPAGIVILLLALGLSILLHEVGHVIGGWASGFRFIMLVAGPVRFYRQGDRVRVGLNRSAALAGGITVSLPNDTRDLVRRMRVYVLAGPVASWLLGLLLFAPPLTPVLDLLLRFTGFASLALGIVTLLPMRGASFVSDGLRLIRLSRGGRVAQREGAILALTALAQSAARPRDLDPDLLATLLTGERDAYSVVAAVYAYSRSLDRGEPAAARDYLALAIAMWDVAPPSIRHTVALEAAFFEAALRQDPVSAENWLNLAGDDALVDPATRLRAEAAVAHAQSDTAQARRKADEALATLDERHTPGMSAAEREWLLTLLRIPPVSNRSNAQPTGTDLGNQL